MACCWLDVHTTQAVLYSCNPVLFSDPFPRTVTTHDTTYYNIYCILNTPARQHGLSCHRLLVHYLGLKYRARADVVVVGMMWRVAVHWFMALNESDKSHQHGSHVC
jgi:hypothetical protein